MVSLLDAVLEVAREVPDPEIPMVTVGDLGMIRDVSYDEGQLVVSITPTYSGCPATEVIQSTIAATIQAAGLGNATVKAVRDPPWTTDWITSRGRARLQKAGIAPPRGAFTNTSALTLFQPPPSITCPQCHSTSTVQLSVHGSTPCKAMYRCKDCLEPFEYFKCR